MKETSVKGNPLGWEDVGKLIRKFAIPAIISGLVGALYNIVDQIFIGQYVGMLGNAATNVSFPITTIATSFSLLIGVGGSANLSLYLGKEDDKTSREIVGNSISFMALGGILIGLIAYIFIEPLLVLFGATEKVMPYAMEYTKIVAIGLPFFIFSNSGSFIIRADGNPNYSMFSITIGAILNVVLDAVFMIKFGMGMKGAALATIIGQIVSSIFVLIYFFRLESVDLKLKDLNMSLISLKRISSLGAAAAFNQLAMTIFQVVMNNTLGHYGSLSKYGSEIPLASVGVISKVNIIYISIVVGIAQGAQPLFGYNYGAKNYKRVKETYKKSLKAILAISLLAFLAFQVFPRQIISVFGDGNELYYEFSVKFFRIYMFLVFINGMQPLTGNFFSAIGKGRIGIFVSMTRQIIFLVPLILILPIFFGIEGIMYAGPIADFAALLVTIYFIKKEMVNMDDLEERKLQSK